MQNDVHLIILAAGSATRMLPIHQNVYPKILVNLGNEVQIKKMLDSYPTAKRRTIFVDTYEQKYQIIEMLNALNVENFEVEALNCGAIGTLATLRSAYARFLSESESKNVLISWSDICPVDKISILPETENNIIFTDNDRRHRMSFDNDEVSFRSDGNMVGLYFVKDLGEIVKKKYDFEDGKSTDLAEVFLHEKTRADNISADFIDTGDVPKYVNYLQNVNIQQRFFNDLKILKDTVIKTAQTEHGTKVLNHEKEFYLRIQGTSAESAFPKLLNHSDNSIEIERVHGKTIHESIVELDEKYEYNDYAKNLYLKFLTACEALHSEKSETPIPDAFNKEYFTVPMERYAAIRNILPELSNVNGTYVDHHRTCEIINTMAELLTTTETLALIHGDPNTSNVMLDHSDKVPVIKFIDPRGQFGGNKFYGDKRYDYAKFLYGLTGYDHFNLTKDVRFDYDRVSKELHHWAIDGYDLDQLTNDPVLKYLVGLIWFKLPLYTINNINKAIVAYGHGLQLITKYGQEAIAKLSRS